MHKKGFYITQNIKPMNKIKVLSSRKERGKKN